MQLEVVSCPSNELALSNSVFLDSQELYQLTGSNGSKDAYVEVAGFVLRALSHESIRTGQIALNAIHRKIARVSMRDRVQVSGFLLPKKNFDLVVLTVEIDFTKARSAPIELDADQISKDVKRKLSGQVLTDKQKLMFEFCGSNYVLTVTELLCEGSPTPSQRGLLSPTTSVIVESSGGSGIKVSGAKSGRSAGSVFKQKDFNFEKLGIGGLDRQFEDIFRRAFASRVFPPHIIARLGIRHVKGMLLFGPPGTGKTLIARQLGKALNGREPKVVNGPEILNKYVGASEENVRKLFEDAEAEEKAKGDQSELHVIIFDEIDAICKSRGSTRDSTGVSDSIVNQLLTKIDGVDALNNILLIGMTNRKDMLDEALLRPGRLEVQIEIGLPDQEGRLKILSIHSAKMKENSFLARDVDLPLLAESTQNFSGAELEGLIKSAASFALKRHINPQDLSAPIDEDNVKVTMADFSQALSEVRPAFGANVALLSAYRGEGMLSCLPRHNQILETCERQVQQVRSSSTTHLLSTLLHGFPGSGKTALAATVAINSGFPFVKMLSADNMVGMSEASKCSAIAKVFDDAYKSDLSLIILDDIERLLEYVSSGPRFSNTILQALLVLVKKPPPQGKRVFVLGTSSLPEEVQRELHLHSCFHTVLAVPTLTKDDIAEVLRSLDLFWPNDVAVATEALFAAGILIGDQMTIKKLLLLVDMAAQVSPDSQRSGGESKIELEQLYQCLQDLS